MRKYPKSYADWEALGQSLLKGAAGNKSEIEKFGLKIADLQKVLDDFIRTNAEQEKAKAV
ncbi:MAG: hypothetical protein COS68_02330 [Elusimicrobia bacterium CG06_land_8_20_14_3_00_38_11]|nr:MAG: hypothetical protein COS68_02330 [Elusimicrobia bacterium CG06_land_8_20_14_3_00_38_11]